MTAISGDCLAKYATELVSNSKFSPAQYNGRRTILVLRRRRCIDQAFYESWLTGSPNRGDRADALEFFRGYEDCSTAEVVFDEE